MIRLPEDLIKLLLSRDETLQISQKIISWCANLVENQCTRGRRAGEKPNER